MDHAGSVSQRLGHANPHITVRVDSHWIPGANQRDMMNALPSANGTDSDPRESAVNIVSEGHRVAAAQRLDEVAVGR